LWIYTLDRYYREKIFTSDDGQYLVVIHTSYFQRIVTEWTDFNKTAIEVFKNGQVFKTFTLKDVIDTTKLVAKEQSVQWGITRTLEYFSMQLRIANIGKKTYDEAKKKNALAVKTPAFIAKNG